MKESKKFVCEKCGKEYKSEEFYKKHIEQCDKKKEMSDDLAEAVITELETTKAPTKAVIEFLTEDIVLPEVAPDIEDKLIAFFAGREITTITLNKPRMKEFKSLWLEFYGRAMLKTCRNGIVNAYKALFYVTEKIKTDRNGTI